MDLVRQHRKPLGNEPSRFVVAARSNLPLPNGFPVLDLACGYGRNSVFLSKQGHEVVAADYCREMLVDEWSRSSPFIRRVHLDASLPLPFVNEAFAAVVVVHFYANGLFKNVRNLVVPGGYIFYESISARGGNANELPAPGVAQDELLPGYTFLELRERLVEGAKSRATLRLIARRDF
jgi:SAM-dependent methyltransferase